MHERQIRLKTSDIPRNIFIALLFMYAQIVYGMEKENDNFLKAVLNIHDTKWNFAHAVFAQVDDDDKKGAYAVECHPFGFEFKDTYKEFPVKKTASIQDLSDELFTAFAQITIKAGFNRVANVSNASVPEFYVHISNLDQLEDVFVKKYKASEQYTEDMALFLERFMAWYNIENKIYSDQKNHLYQEGFKKYCRDKKNFCLKSTDSFEAMYKQIETYKKAITDATSAAESDKEELESTVATLKAKLTKANERTRQDKLLTYACGVGTGIVTTCVGLWLYTIIKQKPLFD